jgi:hypothetical protein
VATTKLSTPFAVAVAGRHIARDSVEAYASFVPNPAGGTAMARALPCHFLSSRRQVLKTAGAATLALASPSVLADAIVKLPLPGGPDERPITTAFPEKGALILQRTRPPPLETPFEVFDQSVFTPNDRF